MASASGEDQPLSLRELARRAGISDGTLRNWERRHPNGLRMRRNDRGEVSVSIADLRAFCAEHPKLRATKVALARLDSPTAGLYLAGLDAGVLHGLLEVVVTAVRASTAAHLDLARSNADQATDLAVTCRAHAAALASALGGLDHALRTLSPPPSAPTVPDPG